MQVKWLLAGGAGLCVYTGAVYATMVLVRGTAPRPQVRSSQIRSMDAITCFEQCGDVGDHYCRYQWAAQAVLVELQGNMTNWHLNMTIKLAGTSSLWVWAFFGGAWCPAPKARCVAPASAW